MGAGCDSDRMELSTRGSPVKVYGSIAGSEGLGRITNYLTKQANTETSWLVEYGTNPVSP